MDSQGQGRIGAETVLTHNRQPERIVKKFVLKGEGGTPEFAVIRDASVAVQQMCSLTRAQRLHQGIRGGLPLSP